MASSISSLGIGSGVLTADVIDQLKEADTSRIIKPIENKIIINNQQQDAEKLLSSLMSSFKANASALSYDTLFDKKTVDIDGKAEVTVETGATVESFTLETVELAKKDITKFGAVASKATDIASADGTLDIKIGANPLAPDKTLSIDYTAGMSLDELAQAITDGAGSDVSASILQTGDGAYSLILTSKSTGEDFAITAEDTSGNLDSTLFAAYDASTNPTGYEKVQTATDSIFKYNGITTTRSTNEIDDLILGVNIKLKEEGDISSVDISQDTSSITGEMQLFVDSYNTLISNLHDMTLKDKETGAEGVFNSNTFVKSISGDLTKAITALSSDNNSLMNYGIELDRNGSMSFDKSVLEEKLADDPDVVELFFAGGFDGAGNEQTGIFETIDEKLKSYTGYGKLLSNFKSDVETEGKNLAERHSSSQASLDARYDIMTKRFTAYDSIISRLNSQFSSLQMMIDAESN
ncbi:MAG: flagellar filament capping protein FliD [Sulfurimonas sp.]|jgi:flagellar hook-associated protein 2|nr:flagellar filament capping protein FliD [Sulfurimonas sp.]